MLTDLTGEIPAMKLFESEKTLAFLDIMPLSRGHSLIIPKHHGAKLTDIPDDQLLEILQVTKSIAKASGAENYNILQNNGRLAHQEVSEQSCQTMNIPPMPSIHERTYTVHTAALRVIISL
jgi:diadenosine tetraphosphate (Ap4A) HIT family hydrolase